VSKEKSSVGPSVKAPLNPSVDLTIAQGNIDLYGGSHAISWFIASDEDWCSLSSFSPGAFAPNRNGEG
jgi:hypothetical protein